MRQLTRKEEKQQTVDLKESNANAQVEAEVLYNSQILLVGAHVTQIALTTGRPVKEVVETYAEAIGELRDWFAGKQVKQRIESLIDQVTTSEWDITGYVAKMKQ